jgi:phosphatidyl-myo-inositol alpha-mannosyltransferase
MRIIQICPYDLNRPGGVRSHIYGLSQSLVDVGHEVVIIGPDSSVEADSNLEWPFIDGIENKQVTFWRDDETINSELETVKSKDEKISEDHENKKSKVGNTKRDHVDVNSRDEITSWDKKNRASTVKCIKIGYRRSALPLWGTLIDFSFASSSEKSSIRDFIEDWKPDVVHFHTPWTPFLSWQIYRLLTKLEIAVRHPFKLIATFHDSPPDSSLGSILGRFVMPMAAKYILPKFDEVISVSEFQSQFISKWSNKKIHIIPNGIRLDHLRETVSWRPSNTILFLGRLEARKGLIQLLEVYKILKERMSEVKLIIAGEGPQRDEGERFSRTHQLDVEFRGMVSEDEKNRLLRTAGILVSPAMYGESFGIVLIEAMATGVPVAGYGNPGYLSVVEGVCEENFPSPGDVSALAGVIEKVLIDTDFAIRLSRKGNKYAQQYDWNLVSQKISILYT